jgi:hypothetical protein
MEFELLVEGIREALARLEQQLCAPLTDLDDVGRIRASLDGHWTEGIVCNVNLACGFLDAAQVPGVGADERQALIEDAVGELWEELIALGALTPEEELDYLVTEEGNRQVFRDPLTDLPPSIPEVERGDDDA